MQITGSLGPTIRAQLEQDGDRVAIMLVQQLKRRQSGSLDLSLDERRRLIECRFRAVLEEESEVWCSLPWLADLLPRFEAGIWRPD